MPSAWTRRNSDQVGPSRRGAGPMPAQELPAAPAHHRVGAPGREDGWASSRGAADLQAGGAGEGRDPNRDASFRVNREHRATAATPASRGARRDCSGLGPTAGRRIGRAPQAAPPAQGTVSRRISTVVSASRSARSGARPPQMRSRPRPGRPLGRLRGLERPPASPSRRPEARTEAPRSRD